MLVRVELFLVVGAQIGYQRIEVVELALVLRKTQLLFVQLHRGIDLSDFAQKIRNLLLLPLELAVLLVKIVDDPDRRLIEFI